MEAELTSAGLRAIIDYDPNSGIFTWRERDRSLFSSERIWKSWNSKFAGLIAGSIDSGGHRQIRVGYRPYLAHRLAWLYANGVWPTDQLDHINGNRDDNRLCNLRETDNAGNSRNQCRPKSNTTGITGVVRHGSRFRAAIKVNYRTVHLGIFPTIEGAAAARRAAEATYGFHANHGRSA